MRHEATLAARVLRWVNRPVVYRIRDHQSTLLETAPNSRTAEQHGAQDDAMELKKEQTWQGEAKSA